MVYHQLFDEDMAKSLRLRGLMIYVSSQKQCPTRPCGCLKRILVPHILSPALVSPETALEMVEAFYKSYSAQIFITDEVEKINNVLLADYFHVGFNPADVAQQLTIIWKLSRTIVGQDEEGFHTARRPTRDDFSPLLKIRNKAGFHLRISLM